MSGGGDGCVRRRSGWSRRRSNRACRIGGGTVGRRNGADLWRKLKAHGFNGSLRVVTEWATRRRRAEKVSDQQLQRVPSARTIARLITVGRNQLSKADSVTVTAIETGVPMLVEARKLLERFHTMVRRKSGDLDSWITEASTGLLALFGAGIGKDRAAVAAAIREPWSNGQTEGQVNRLKLIKRSMYGRAKVDLIEARLIGAA